MRKKGLGISPEGVARTLMKPETYTTTRFIIKAVRRQRRWRRRIIKVNKQVLKLHGSEEEEKEKKKQPTKWWPRLCFLLLCSKFLCLFSCRHNMKTTPATTTTTTTTTTIFCWCEPQSVYRSITRSELKSNNKNKQQNSHADSYRVGCCDTLRRRLSSPLPKKWYF